MVPGRFKDYISTPKQNDYRSIHTTVIGPGKQRVELQIRTGDMDEIAEYGIAAHALYKDGTARRPRCSSRESRTPMRGCAAPSSCSPKAPTRRNSSSTPSSSCSTTRCSASRPKGRLIALPRKATPIDFAYAVHTDVGNTRSAARSTARSRRSSPSSQNGDEVEIITSKAQDAPPAAWESLVVTGKARAAIRRATRGGGARANMPASAGGSSSGCSSAPSASIRTRSCKARCRGSRAPRIEDVLAAVGRGEMCAADVVRAMYPDYKDERAVRAGDAEGGASWFGLRRGKAVKFQVPSGTRRAAIPIRGINSDLPVRFAPNGGAVPGDRIVGIMTPGEGITIYPIQSASARGVRGRARALARRALGRRRGHAAALPGAASRCSRSTSRARWRRSPR